MSKTENRTLKKTVRAIKELCRFDRDWNGAGVLPIPPAVADAAAGFVDALWIVHVPMPAVVPTVRGGIQLEWHRNGIDLEVGFSPLHPSGVQCEVNFAGPITGEQRLDAAWLVGTILKLVGEKREETA